MESEFEVTHLYCEGLRPEAGRDLLPARASDDTTSTGKRVARYVRVSNKRKRQRQSWATTKEDAHEPR